MSLSVVMTLKNRAHLLKYCLEGIQKQDYSKEKLEICILDGGSTDNLLSTIDRFSDVFTFKFAFADRSKSYIPICSNCPANEINLLVKYMASNDSVVKIDPEIVMKDEWILSEIEAGLNRDNSRPYNARCFFTEGDTWYRSYSDIVRDHIYHAHIAEGGLFSRSRFYFLSGFSKTKFIEMGGVEELTGWGAGYDDTLFRETWKNRYGDYEQEITGTAVHLWHGHNRSRPAWEVTNSRIFDSLKEGYLSNTKRLDGQNNLITLAEPRWANPEMLSKIYTIQGGRAVEEEDINGGNSLELSLPF